MNDGDLYSGGSGDPFGGGSGPDTIGSGDPLSVDEPLSADAPATTSESDADGWWGLESDAPAAAWKDAHSSHLQNLLRVPSMDESPESPPWKPKYDLHVRGFGGLVSKDRNRYTLVGHEGRFVNQIGGSRTVTADYHSTRVRRGRTDVVGGRDRLTVKGDASYDFKSRTLMMGGSITRNWRGGIVRMASMEGAICGGAMTRVIVGPSGTMSGMLTGDVYGAIGRASATRIYLALLQYRAAQQAAWALGMWIRNTTFTIVPAAPAPQTPTPTGNASRKVGRLTKVATKAWKAAKAATKALKMVCPVVDIFLGLIMLPFALYSAGALAKMLIMSLLNRNKLPPAGPPRVEIRNCGMTAVTYATKQFT